LTHDPRELSSEPNEACRRIVSFFCSKHREQSSMVSLTVNLQGLLQNGSCIHSTLSWATIQHCSPCCHSIFPVSFIHLFKHITSVYQCCLVQVHLIKLALNMGVVHNLMTAFILET